MIGMRAAKADGIERRFSAFPVQVRGTEDGKPMLSGRAIVYNVSTVIGDPMRSWSYEEEIAPKSISNLDTEDVIVSFNHNWDMLLGRVSNGTLRMKDGPDGLDVEIDVDPETSMGKDVMRMVARGDVKGMSFSFSMDGEKRIAPKDRGGMEKRIVTSLRLWELGPVALPAYESTKVSVARSRMLEAEAEAEAKERDAAEAARKGHNELLASIARRAFEGQFGGAA